MQEQPSEAVLPATDNDNPLTSTGTPVSEEEVLTMYSSQYSLEASYSTDRERDEVCLDDVRLGKYLLDCAKAMLGKGQ
jgi:hypothetical protein